MKLNIKRTIFVGFAFLIIQLFWNVYDQVIPKILVNTFGLNQTWSGFIMALDNILALFLLPFFGNLSDKMKSKRGRRTPFIIVGTICAAVLLSFVAIIDKAMLAKDLLANSDLVTNTTLAAYGNDVEAFEAAWAVRQQLVASVRAENILLMILFIGVLLLVLIAMALFRSPAVALMPDVTPKPLRSEANAIINLMGVVGGVLGLGAIAVLSADFSSYVPLFIVVSVLMIVGLIIFLWKVNEPKLVETRIEEEKAAGYSDELEAEETQKKAGEKSGIRAMDPKVRRSFLLILASVLLWYMAYNAASSKYSLYAQNVLGVTSSSLAMMVAQGVAAVGFIPIGIFSSKIGRRKTILIGIIILVLGFVLGSFIGPNSAWVVYIVMSIIGIGWAAINVNSYPMVVEMGKSGEVGKFTGYYYAASMAAQVATPILSGALMDVSGTMRVLFPYCAVMGAAAFITMFFVKHGDAKPVAKKKLIEHLDAGDD